MPTAKQPSKKTTEAPTAGHIVWQWVTYGLWEWALIALSILLSATLAYYFVDKSSDYEFAIYTLAALVCLLPLALVADRSYRTRELPQKQGFSGVVMVLNAVLVFLATVGGLITAVISGLRLLVDTNASDGTVTAILSSLVVTVLGALLFVRIIGPEPLQKVTRMFHWVVSGVAIITIVLACAGPVVRLVQTRDDRAIEQNAGGVQAAIDQFIWDNNRLPADLSEVNIDQTYQEGVSKLITDKRIRYRQLPPEMQDGTKVFAYELCATFERVKGTSKKTGTINSAIYAHPEGEACYTQRVVVKDIDKPRSVDGL